jgi:hypothetical protein
MTADLIFSRVQAGTKEGVKKGWSGLIWLWIPRLVAAVLATYLFSAFSFARRLYAKRACHKKICNH